MHQGVIPHFIYIVSKSYNDLLGSVFSLHFYREGNQGSEQSPLAWDHTAPKYHRQDLSPGVWDSSALGARDPKSTSPCSKLWTGDFFLGPFLLWNGIIITNLTTRLLRRISMYSTKHSGSHVASTPLILTAVTIRTTSTRTTSTRARTSTTIATSFLALAQNHKVPTLSQGQPGKVEWCLPWYSAVHNSKAPSSPAPSHPELLDSILHRKSSPLKAVCPDSAT